jgi:thiol-disulfide isomerase/thioredoxin
MSSRTAGLVSQLKKHQHTLLIVAGVIIVVGAIYMLASMKTGVATEGFATVEELPRLDGAQFSVADDETVMVFFKMVGCGHCETFAPTWVKLYEKLNGSKLPSGKKLRMLIVDAQDPFAKKSDIAGYPTIRKYTSTTDFIDHEAARDETTVTEFIMS